MTKEDRDELLELAQAAHGERWCVHPNGTSVWTGEEYQPDPNVGAPQYMVCKQVNPLDEIEVSRMEFIAGCSPHVVLELLEFYGLSDTVLKRGMEDTDEVCSVCEYATTEGHTHEECFENGRTMGGRDQYIECEVALADALGTQEFAYSFETMVQMVKQLRADAETLAQGLEKSDGYMTTQHQQAFDRVRADK